MKKLTFILLLIPIFSNAQIRRTEYDSAWQRQFNLNQGFGTNINTLLTANGERRRQVERLQLDSAVKAKQIADLIARVAALEKVSKDTFTIGYGLKLNKKDISLDSSITNKLYAVKDAEPAIVELAKMYTAIAARTKTVEGKLEDAIARVVILEAFKQAIKNL